MTNLLNEYAWVSVAPRPGAAVLADDRMTAAAALRLVSADVGVVWFGDYHNGRQLLAAMGRRLRRPGSADFLRYRAHQGRRAELLGKVLVPLDPGYVVPLRRAPDVRDACAEVYGPVRQRSLVPLRELLGVIGAHEWRRKGVWVPALEARIHPHYGVFSPVRGEYVDLVANAPKVRRAFDIGTGTGVLAAVLAKRGAQEVVATDDDPRAVACARENMRRLAVHVDVRLQNLFPDGKADLVVCNPPWLPAEPHTSLDHAVYDPGSRMLAAFLDGLPAHLTPGGEGWLLLSDLAEHLGLRTRAQLMAMIDAAGLRVTGRTETRPRHPKTSNRADPLYPARTAEITSLWQLANST